MDGMDGMKIERGLLGAEFKAPAAESPAGLGPLRAALLDWYDQSGRELPWRAEPSPYRAVVSEFMLQQTQIATVLPYFDSFLKRFPDFESLASASEADVVAAWSGLGYYRRARLLRRAAEAVWRDHGGGLPADAEALRALPGFGPYTAAAVGSIALGLPLAAVDGNIRRVMSRLFMIAGAGESARVEAAARAALDPGRPGDWNQALMDLGAMVCRPRDPDCAACPVVAFCAAKRANRVGEFPAARPAPATVRVRETAVAVLRGGALLLLLRAASGSFAGMWELPRSDNRSNPLLAAPGPTETLESLTGMRVASFEKVGSARSVFTHHRIETELHRGRARAGAKRLAPSHEAAKCFTPAEIAELPIGRAQRRLVAMLGEF